MNVYMIILVILLIIALVFLVASGYQERGMYDDMQQWMNDTVAKISTLDRRILTLERKTRSKDNPYTKEETTMTTQRMNEIQKWTQHLDMKTLDTADQLAMAQATTEYFEKINQFYEKYAKVREERVR